MNLATHMIGDQLHDPKAVGGRKALVRIREPLFQSIHPQTAIWVQHYLDDCGIFQPGCNTRAERGSQHPRPPRCCLLPDCWNAHSVLLVCCDPTSGTPSAPT